MKEKLLEFISELREIDKMLLLFALLDIILLRYVWASNADLVRKLLASSILLSFISLSAIANGALREREETKSLTSAV